MVGRGDGRTSIRRWSGVTLLASAALLGVAACGGDDDGTTTAATPAGGGTGGAQTVKVAETEYKLDPDNPTVKPGKVSFDVTNDGQMVHSLTVEGPDGGSTLDKDLQPGDSGELTVDLSAPGKYEFFCPIDGQKGLGMVGDITVGSGAAADAGGGGGGGASGGGGYGY
jgi:uncharacterized cupredoxin-like copper-binding protein